MGPSSTDDDSFRLLDVGSKSSNYVGHAVSECASFPVAIMDVRSQPSIAAQSASKKRDAWRAMNMPVPQTSFCYDTIPKNAISAIGRSNDI